MLIAPWQEAQLRAMIHSALAARARGLYFTSETRLDADDPATRARAAMLELVNLELQLIERWPAAGNFAASADSSDHHTTGAVIETDRSRLLLPIYTPPGGQFVTGTQASAVISYTVAGVPEGDDAYELSLTGLRALRATRLTGGTRVVLEDRSRDSLVVFTRDPNVYRNLKEGIEKTRRRAAFLARELAKAELAHVDAVTARLGQLGRSVPLAQEARTTATGDLQQAELHATDDIRRAYDAARHALQVLRQIERVYWEQETAGPAEPLADPLAATFTTLPEHIRLMQAMAALPRSENRLAEGGCENISAMLAAGWKHFQHRRPGIETGVLLAPRARIAGARVCCCWPKPPTKRIAPVPSPPRRSGSRVRR